jgi:helicase
VKPFQQAEILKKKKERLSELNKLLDMGNSDKIKENSWNKEKEGNVR